MKIFKTDQIHEIDAWTIEHEPVASIDLMERAARACSGWIMDHFSQNFEILVFCGPGNNGGDGLAIARQMHNAYYKVKVFIVHTGGKFSVDFSLNRKRLESIASVAVDEIDSINQLPRLGQGMVVIDVLFGSGLARPVSGFPAEVIRHINQSDAFVIAIDIPSGLFGEDNQGNEPSAIIHAKHTLTFQFPKLSFFFGPNHDYTGEWHVLQIGLNEAYISEKETDIFFLDESTAAGLLRERPKFSHKGTYGHALLIAGCYGMMGAAVLAARACLKAGVGLVTTHVPGYGYPIIQTAVPESLISIDESDIIFTDFPELEKFNAVAVGPAINCKPNAQEGLQHLLRECKVPMVIDADALNILGQHKDWIELVPENSILTPHPREFERIAGRFDDPYERNQKQVEFAVKHKVYIILKGAYSAIACPDETCWFNSTGNPGMATGGSGDVLTGIVLSLLAQGYQPKNAALLGTFIHGLAGDLAAFHEGEEGVIASDIIQYIGKAFIQLRKIKNES